MKSRTLSDDDAPMGGTEEELASDTPPAGGSPRKPQCVESSAAPMEVYESELAPDEVAEALAALRQAGLDQIDTGSETEGSTPEPVLPTCRRWMRLAFLAHKNSRTVYPPRRRKPSSWAMRLHSVLDRLTALLAGAIKTMQKLTKTLTQTP